MDIHLGNLKFVLAKEHPELMAPAVTEAISKLPGAEKIGVVEIDPDLSDTAAFCEKYEVGMNQAANCVILEAKRADKSWFAACVILGNTKADVNGLARRTLDARKVSFAPMEKAVAESAMEYGAITPIGLPATWSILFDQAVANSEYVIIGSGIRKSKLAIPGSLFTFLPNVKILNGLAKVTEITSKIS
jgi:prolyl-tRNA editing enzyme YbaK/EbsC (Cys-tRNA(Pro) deacylase)